MSLEAALTSFSMRAARKRPIKRRDLELPFHPAGDGDRQQFGEVPQPASNDESEASKRFARSASAFLSAAYSECPSFHEVCHLQRALELATESGYKHYGSEYVQAAGIKQRNNHPKPPDCGMGNCPQRQHDQQRPDERGSRHVPDVIGGNSRAIEEKESTKC